MDDSCYYCGAAATTREHVPPKCIFPKQADSIDGADYRRDLITVPSCEGHNTAKSREDEYLLYILAMSLPTNQVGTSQFLTKIRRAIERRPKLLDQLLLEWREVTVHDTKTDEWHKTIAVQPEERRLIAIFTSIAKALYFYERNARWLGQVRIVIEFMVSLVDLAMNERQRNIELHLDAILQGVERNGENPDVFFYQFTDHDGQGLARFSFFGGSRVTAVYEG